MKVVRRYHLQDTVELNITAFMNLMVILVPFLLITAVFSRMTVLELNLPALDAKQKAQEEVELELHVVIRAGYVDIQDKNLGLIKRFEYETNDAHLRAFTDTLLEIKSRFPETTSIVLLLEKSVSYKTLIQFMDVVRSAQVVQAATLETVELFPDISIGDAYQDTQEQETNNEGINIQDKQNPATQNQASKSEANNNNSVSQINTDAVISDLRKSS